MAGLNHISIADYQRNLVFICVFELATRKVTSEEEALKENCQKTLELVNKYEKLEQQKK